MPSTPSASRNRLVKAVRRSYVAGSPGIPANPGRPYQPARPYVETVEICEFQFVNPVGLVQRYIPPNPFVPGDVGQYIWVPDPLYVNTSVSTGPWYAYVCNTIQRVSYFPEQSYIPPTPAVPPVASQTLVDYQLGWTGRARSVRSVPGPARVSFKVTPTSVGAVVGLNNSFAPSGYRDIRFAFYVSNGIARVMEAGAVKYTHGAIGADDVLSIRRAGGRATYFVNGVEIYSSSNSDGPLHLDAALYSGDDMVADPAFGVAGDGFGTLAALAGFASDRALAAAHAVLQPLSATAGEFRRSLGTLSALTGLASDRPYGAAQGVLSPLTGEGEAGGVVPSYAVAGGPITLITGVSQGMTGEVGAVDGVLDIRLTGLASDRVYGEARGMLNPISGVAFGGDAPDEVSFGARGVGRAVMQGGRLVALAFLASEEVVAFFDTDHLKAATLFASGEGRVSFDIAALSGLSFLATGQGVYTLSDAGDVVDVWVFNSEAGGFTRYENFGFNSFATLGGVHYGCRSDGVYRLEGDTDAGDPIQAMVSFGKQGFGTSMMKRVTNAYAGVSSQGRMVLKVVVEGQEYFYTARGNDPQIQMQRFDTGKGLRANWLEFELYNADGDDFELASVEFAAVPLSRRI